MNAAVRAVAQRAFHEGWEVFGIEGALGGLLEGRMREVDRQRLGGLMRRSGTFLGTGRSKEVREEEGKRRAIGRLEEAGVEGLVVIGGGGSLTSAESLGDLGVPVVGIPATIDNDIVDTDPSLGVDTAVETAVDAIDRVRGTAISHNRAHVVEVAGSGCGYLAVMAAIAGGAEAAVVPEYETRPEDLLRFLEEAYREGKSHFVVVVAEGAGPSARELQGYVNEAEGGYEADLTAVGHIQSGGDPTAADRILATRLGSAPVEALVEGEAGVMVGSRGAGTERVPLGEVVGKDRPVDEDTYDELAGVLAELSTS
jgi:6-phosphofructokinase 1